MTDLISIIPAAHDAIIENRVMDALLLLTESTPLDKAIDLLAPDRTPRVGDLLCCSWGYDQTNVDYYQVVGVTGKSARVRAIRGQVLPSDRGSTTDLVVPVVDAFEESEEPFTRRFRLTRWRGEAPGYNVRIGDHGSARLWDGKPQGQTAAGYGH